MKGKWFNNEIAIPSEQDFFLENASSQFLTSFEFGLIRRVLDLAKVAQKVYGCTVHGVQ